MLKHCSVLLLVAGLGLALISCEKLPSGPSLPASKGQLSVEAVKFQDAIPMDYGNLVGVTPHPETAKWAALWFEKPDKTITVVWVNFVEGKMGDRVTKIPRK